MSDNDEGRGSRAGSATQRQLGPVRTGHETPPNEVRPSSMTPRDVEKDIASLEAKKKDPLPPIGVETEDTDYFPPSSSELIGSTMAGSGAGSRTQPHRPPKVVSSFRRETDDDDDDSLMSDDSVKPKEEPPMVMNKEEHYVTNPDGSEKLIISIECQTEWSYLDDMKKFGHQDTSRTSGKSRNTPHDSVSIKDRQSTTPRNADSKLSGSGSEAPLPVPSRADEYGIPILHLSSDSEDSDDDSLLAYQMQQQQYSQENEYDDAREVGTLPSIGPPQILQYQRESKKHGVDLDDPELRLISEQEFEEYRNQYGDIQSGMFEGECEFCHKQIKPFPSLEDQKRKDPSQLYCCTEYAEFVHFMINHPLHQQHQADRKIDVKPHPPYGSKQARRMAKERAAQRMRERELARQQAAINAGRDGGGGGGGGNFYQIARQMKTINYQLSSQKCLEEGWTIRPPSPMLDDGPGEVFEPEPILPAWAEDELKKKRRRQLILKHYEDGSKFIILFPDGTGTVYYPSGRPAITISSLEQGLFTYVVTEDSDPDERNQASVLAVFEPNGYGVSYFNNGQVRVYLDQIGGLELDGRGSKKRKWSWKEQVQHIHAPPLQPITFAVTPQFGVRIMAQDNITLTYSNKQRSCRFQVGAKLRLVAPENLQPDDFDEDELFRQEVANRIESLFNKVSNLLKFPKSPKLGSLPTPQHLTSRVQKLSKIKEEKRERGKRKQAPPGVVTVN